MKNVALDTVDMEVARIKEAYTKREINDLYSWFNPSYLFMVQEREKRLLKFLHKYDVSSLESKKILEIGCGTGLTSFRNGSPKPKHDVRLG